VKGLFIKGDGGMEDSYIVDLYWKRSENAISETASKYGKYCQTIARNILFNNEDSEEAVNDTYLSAWNSMPPHRPSILSTYLGKITRRISLNMWRDRNRDKRGGGEVTLALDELEECIPSSYSVEQAIQAAELSEVIDRFIVALPTVERRVFVCRYWYLDPLSAICKQFGFSQAKVKSMLYRTRGKLLDYLKKEDFLNEK
jgi:RNA polymerase sigma-70 factor (ECF subfamily)